MHQHGASVATSSGEGSDSSGWAWNLIFDAHRLARSGKAPERPQVFGADPAGRLRPLAARGERGVLAWRPERGWDLRSGFDAAERDLLELYLPLCGPLRGEAYIVGHLGQSLDGCVATQSGDSRSMTGRENIAHLHRMRALCDSVIVGAHTVAADDPRLTTRLVAGDNPVRVVLDPRRRLHARYRVFCDGAAPTLLVCGRDQIASSGPRHGQAEAIGIGCHGGRLDIAELRQRLKERGLGVSFVEGGGATVTAFLEAGLLDRLQLAVAPQLTGNGRPGLRLPAVASMRDSIRPRCRVFRMGEDILFDLEPRSRRGIEDQAPAATGVQRLY